MRHPDPHFGYPTAPWRARERPAAITPPPSRHRFLRQGTQVLDTHIDAIDGDSALQRILTWGSRHQSRIVTFCRVDTLVQASRDPALHRAIAQADLALPGDPSVAWAMRSEGQRIMVYLLGGMRTGFIVDSVAEVLRIPRSQIAPAPRMSEAPSS